MLWLGIKMLQISKCLTRNNCVSLASIDTCCIERIKDRFARRDY